MSRLADANAHADNNKIILAERSSQFNLMLRMLQHIWGNAKDDCATIDDSDHGNRLKGTFAAEQYSTDALMIRQRRSNDS